MRQNMSIRRRIISLCSVLIMLVGMASAEGLFPSMDQLFGTAMPSIGVALGRSTDETIDTKRGKIETYRDFTYEDYTAFGSYLAGEDAVLKDTKVTENDITTTLSVRGASMDFIYDWRNKTATAVYTSGTRPETERSTQTQKANILPPVGGIMPSAQFAVNRKPDRENAADDGITQIWEDFTDDDYSAFSTYLAKTGATLKNSSTEGGILLAEISLNACSFTFSYDWHSQTASVFYPNGTEPERKEWNTLTGNGNILPEMNTIGNELPSMSQALSREPDIVEENADGSRIETYSNFDEEDYTVFSKYLQTTDCTVDDYHVESGNVMVIQLSNPTGSFTFTYDTLGHIGTMTYPKGSRIEAAWTAPTATPKSSATASSKILFSESYCWKSAKAYFSHLSWKNSKSVTINSYTSAYSSYDNVYIFYIDYFVDGYDAKSNYIIAVSAETGRVTVAGNEK